MLTSTSVYRFGLGNSCKIESEVGFYVILEHYKMAAQ